MRFKVLRGEGGRKSINGGASEGHGDIVIREMTEDDLPQVYRINKESFTTDAWLLEAFKREFGLPYSYKYVLEKENKIIGYLILWIIDKEATVMTFAIDKAYRGMGLGKYFFKEVMERLNNSIDRILLDVRKSNIKAIKLYKSLGFKILGERKKFYSDGEDALLMGKEMKCVEGKR